MCPAGLSPVDRTQPAAAAVTPQTLHWHYGEQWADSGGQAQIKEFNRQLTENIPNWSYYSQLGISNTQLGINNPIGDNISNWWLGISESGRAASENKSQIPNLINVGINTQNWEKYHQLGIWNTWLGILYPIGYFLLLVLYCASFLQPKKVLYKILKERNPKVCKKIQHTGDKESLDRSG